MSIPLIRAYERFNPDVRDDIQLLHETKNIFRLKVVDNHLVRKDISDIFYDFIQKIKSFFGFKDQNQELLKGRIIHIVRSLGKLEGILGDHDAEEIIRDLFFNKISQLKDKKLFKKLKEKQEGTEQALSKEVENFLNPELGIQRQKKRTETSLTEEELQVRKLSRQVEKARLAISLGAGVKFSRKGVSGTQFVESLKGRKIGVFKPTHEHAPLMTRIINIFKRNFHGQLYFLSRENDSQSKAEVAAYIADNYFGFHLSPRSVMATFAGRNGAFQSLLTNDNDQVPYEEVSGEIAESLRERTNFDEEELDIFQLSAVFDYLIGNLDRHEENWFVKRIDGKIRGIKLIDNANSFIRKNPMYLDQVRNQYKWKELKISEPNFTENTKAFIREKFVDAKIDEFIQKLEEKIPGFLQDLPGVSMREHLIERIKVLRKCATRDDFSPKKLADLVTDESINAFLT